MTDHDDLEKCDVCGNACGTLTHHDITGRWCCVNCIAKMKVTDTIGEVEHLVEENEKLRYIAGELQWMARRYADGRMTSVVDVVNELTASLIEMNIQLKQDVGKQLFARDGTRGFGLSEKYMEMEERTTRNE